MRCGGRLGPRPGLDRPRPVHVAHITYRPVTNLRRLAFRAPPAAAGPRDPVVAGGHQARRLPSRPSPTGCQRKATPTSLPLLRSRGLNVSSRTDLSAIAGRRRIQLGVGARCRRSSECNQPSTSEGVHGQAQRANTAPRRANRGRLITTSRSSTRPSFPRPSAVRSGAVRADTGGCPWSSAASIARAWSASNTPVITTPSPLLLSDFQQKGCGQSQGSTFLVAQGAQPLGQPLAWQSRSAST